MRRYDTRKAERARLTFRLPQERADELLDAIDAVVGDNPFSYLGESFVGSHCGAYIAAKRPQQVRLRVASSFEPSL